MKPRTLPHFSGYRSFSERQPANLKACSSAPGFRRDSEADKEKLVAHRYRDVNGNQTCMHRLSDIHVGSTYPDRICMGMMEHRPPRHPSGCLTNQILSRSIEKIFVGYWVTPPLLELVGIKNPRCRIPSLALLLASHRRRSQPARICLCSQTSATQPSRRQHILDPARCLCSTPAARQETRSL